MRELDGSEAGGQFLRTALALAAIESEPVRITDVRGSRPNPGLKHQHLAVVEAMAAICDARVSGAELGSETVEFEPETDGGIHGGEYAVDVDTAGSVTLLFDALLPLATRLESPLSLTATGGTDVAWSPPIDYYRRVKLPLLRRFGLEGSVEVDRRGFYPAGGGRATLHIEPSTIEPIRLDERGAAEGVRLYSIEAAALADADVATRQADGALERLSPGERDLAVRERIVSTVETDCPGSAIVVRLDFAGTIAGFSALGEPGKPAERVGEDAADAAIAFLDGEAAVDRHLADQLLVFLALAGGRVRVSALTDHAAASLALLESFGYEGAVENEGAVGGEEVAIGSGEAPVVAFESPGAIE